ncbi:MAG: cbb3-type cytochrome oxidase assembly protein [Nitrosomonadales bacterium]|nr:cbb3-type cytochrome oxidase assembly protein [Nitrosomonadales bacterium]
MGNCPWHEVVSAATWQAQRLAILIRAVRKGQYEDLESNASRILLDDDGDAMLIGTPEPGKKSDKE